MKDKNNWRKKIYLQIEPRQYSGQISLYNIVLTAVIAAGTLPLVVRETWPWFRAIEIIAAFAFSADYILRWVTADYKLAKPGREPFRRYPFMILSVIDLAAAISYLLLAFVPALAQHRWLMILRVSGVLKLLPLTGVTLPFVSYGGTSLISSLCLIGFIQGVGSVNEDHLAGEARLRVLSGR